MRKLWNWMDGNKSYLGAVAAGLLGICYSENWVSDETAMKLAAAITTLTGIAIRSAVKKLEPKK